MSDRERLGAPSVSVVIPAYNAEAFIARAIDSVLAQTYAVREVIVVDDGSRDGTAGVVARCGGPVRLVQQANAGPAAARNHGARLSRSEWIGLLDADDAWKPEKLERQVAAIDSTRVGVVHCLRSLDPMFRIPPRVTFDTLWEGNCIVNSSALIRRAAFEEAGGFDEDRALISVEDYNLWLRLAAKGWEIVTVPEVLHHYTPAPNSLSAQYERFARAELANLEKVSTQLSLSPELVHAKRVAIHEAYGRDLLHQRELRAARKWLGYPLRNRPSLPRLAWWLATFMPSFALDRVRKPYAGA